MKLDELMQKYGFLLDEEGRYYRINSKGKRVEPFATTRVIAKIFNVSHSLLPKKFRLANMEATAAKAQGGQVCGHYNINDAKLVCSQIATPSRSHKASIKNSKLPQVPPIFDTDNLLIYENERYANMFQLMKTLSLSERALTNRIKKFAIPAVISKNAHGHSRVYFNFNRIKAACADLLNTILNLDDRGMVTIEGNEYATVLCLVKITGLSEPTVRQRLKMANLNYILAKNKIRRALPVYNVALAKQACEDLLKNIPVTDSNSITIVNNRSYASVFRLTKILRRSKKVICKIICQNNLKPVSAKSQTGHLIDVYDIELVTKFSSDTINKHQSR